MFEVIGHQVHTLCYFIHKQTWWCISCYSTVIFVCVYFCLCVCVFVFAASAYQ